MKIAVVRRECTYTRGGAERYAANLSKALADLGHQVFVVAEKCDADLHPAIKHMPVRVNRMTSGSRHRSFHVNSQRVLAEIGADAVLALSRTFPADAFRVSDPLHEFWMNIRYPGRIRQALEKLNPRHRTILKLERAILDPTNTRWIVTNSELSKRIIGELSAFPQERIRVIYNGVDHAQFSPGPERAPDPADEIRFLFVGQDFKRKGLAPLIRAFAKVHRLEKKVRLRVIGRDRPGLYQQLARQLGLADSVTFEGATRKIHEAYRAADLLVFPTFYDPFANVCLEAFACGLPVLTTTTNGASEIIDEGKNGYVVDGAAEGLEIRLAEKLQRFVGLSLAERKQMRTVALAKAADFTVEANARAIADLLAST